MTTSKDEKKRWTYEEGLAVARVLYKRLLPACEPERIKAAGSLRRGLWKVGDVELVYVPQVDDVRDLLGEKEGERNLADEEIDRMIAEGLLAKRKNKLGHEAFGSKNKLMVHVPTGMPVDLFAATEENYWNLVVCRTGGKRNNIAIAAAAQQVGLRWTPYGPGFQNPDTGAVIPVHSEEAVFEVVGLPYRKPPERE